MSSCLDPSKTSPWPWKTPWSPSPPSPAPILAVLFESEAGSRYVGPIRAEVEQWQKDLLLFQETLDEWLNVQRNWMYLESIFNAGDIKKQLPGESAKFQEIDVQWRQIMKDFEHLLIYI